jgi:hypothetical protein
MTVPTRRGWRQGIAGIGVVLGLIAYFAMGRLLLRNWRLRYELTIEVETPEGRRRGSSVIQVSVKRTVPFWGDNGIHFQVEGKAPAVELPDGRLVFALLRDSTNEGLPELAVKDTNAMPAISDRLRRMDTGAFWSHLKAKRPDMFVDAAMMSRRITPSAGARYPTIVVVDPAAAKPIQSIDPANAEDVLGPGFGVAGLELRIVDRPPDMASDPPWLARVSQALDDMASSGLPNSSMCLARFIDHGGR